MEQDNPRFRSRYHWEDVVTRTKLLHAARALSAALEAVQNMETPAEREIRLSEGRSSPTGWPIKRIVRATVSHEEPTNA